MQVATTAGQVAGQANDLLPGSVSAPEWVLPLAAVVAAVVGGGFFILLNPGKDVGLLSMLLPISLAVRRN